MASLKIYDATKYVKKFQIIWVAATFELNKLRVRSVQLNSGSIWESGRLFLDSLRNVQ